MASVWIVKRPTKSGKSRYRVEWRGGGREAPTRYGGSFKTLREAEAQKKWFELEFASHRVPDLKKLEPPAPVETFEMVAERWRQSRVDVAGGTAQTHVVNLARIVPRIGMLPIDRVGVADVADVLAALTKDGLARESVRKTRSTAAMVLDFAGIQPNPARDKSVKLPREQSEELTPPTADQIEAVHRILSGVNRLALVALDATGMRVSELQALDVDEPAGRWCVRRDASKTRRTRWVPVVPVEVFDTVVGLVPREDRDLDGQVFAGFGADRFRTALTRACKASGTPAFSPHDIRHRRATLLHLQGVPVAEAAAWLGHSPTEHLKTYAHATLSERREIDYRSLLHADAHTVPHLGAYLDSGIG